jgi:phospholipase C
VRDHRPSSIKHVFVLMLENRSFDHLLGFSGITGTDAATGQATSLDGLHGSESNAYNGVTYTVQHGAPDRVKPPDRGLASSAAPAFGCINNARACATQVMLAARFRATVGQKQTRNRETNSSRAHQRGVPSMWLKPVQEKWSYPLWEAAISVQRANASLVPRPMTTAFRTSGAL